jgi:transposase
MVRGSSEARQQALAQKYCSYGLHRWEYHRLEAVRKQKRLAGWLAEKADTPEVCRNQLPSGWLAGSLRT